MNRRKFIQDSALMASAWGCGAFLFNGCRGASLQSGQEWNQATVFEASGLRPRDLVLEEANQNIRRHRMGNLQLQLRAGDRPLANRPVRIKMKDHYFDWGCSAIKGRSAFLHEGDFLQYMAQVRRVFNATTAKCYWDERWHQPIEHQEGKRMVGTFLEEVQNGSRFGMRVKGHPLVWTVPKAIPGWLMQYDASGRISRLEAHVKDLVLKGGNAINNWDVVNEMLWEPAFKNIDHRHWPHIDPINEIADYVAQALKWVEEENPGVKKLINDYGLIKEFTPLQSVKTQRERYLLLITALRERGRVPDAIGVQSHVGKWFEPDELVKAYDELAKGGLPIHVTEFWARMQDCPHACEELMQEEKDLLLENYLRDFYTVAFGHPAVAHITYWGNPFFDDKNQPTLYYRVLESLVCQEWNTQGLRVTDEKGVVSIEAFFGEYELSVDNERYSLSFTPSESGVINKIQMNG